MLLILLFFLLALVPGWSAIAVVQQCVNTILGGGSSTTQVVVVGTTDCKDGVTVSTNPGSGSILLVMLASENNSATITLTGTLGETFTQINAASCAGTVHKMVAFWGLTTSSGQDTLTATWSTAATFRWMSVKEVTGLNTSAPVDQANCTAINASSASWDSGNITTTVANTILIAGANSDSSGTVFTAGTGYARLSQNLGSDSMAIEDKILSSTATDSGNITLGVGSTGIMNVVALKQAGSTPAVVRHRAIIQ